MEAGTFSEKNIFQNCVKQTETLQEKVKQMPPRQPQQRISDEFFENILFTFPDSVACLTALHSNI